MIMMEVEELESRVPRIRRHPKEGVGDIIVARGIVEVVHLTDTVHAYLFLLEEKGVGRAVVE